MYETYLIPACIDRLNRAYQVKIHSLSTLLPLDQRHRRDIDPPRTDPIIRPRRHNHERKNDNRPIHTLRPRQRRLREERKHKAQHQKCQRNIINQRPPLPQRPPPLQQFFTAETLEANGADGNDVGEEQGSV